MTSWKIKMIPMPAGISMAAMWRTMKIPRRMTILERILLTQNEKRESHDIKDENDFSTARNVLLLIGFVYDGSLLSKIRVPIFALFLYTAPIHHMLPVFVDKNATQDEILIAVSLALLYSLLWFSWPFMIYHSSHVVKFWKTIRQGFYKYQEPFSEEERTIMSKANDITISSTKISLIAYFCAGFGTYLKEMSPESIREYRTPYPGWFPFEINSNFRFAVALWYQLCLCLNTTFALEGIFLLFAFHTIHFEAQLKVLKQHYEDTFPPDAPASLTHRPDNKARTMRRLKECVQHHLVITGFHKEILSYFGLCLFVYRVVCTIMLCILCYMTTTGISLNKLMQVVCLTTAILYLLLIFCLKGEQVVAMSDVWRKTLYDVDWWSQPVEVQKTVLMMQAGASKVLHIYGLWKPAMYSHGGISVIGQESFSFLNMLRAMKLVALAFAGSVGMTLVILACALPKFNSVWWPFFVVVLYLFSPIPTLIARRYTERTGSTNSSMDLAIFITMLFVVSSFGLPIVLARTDVIQWAACYLTLAGNVVVFITYIGFFVTLYQDDSDYNIW